MRPEDGLRARLAGTAEVTVLVPAIRIQPERMAQGIPLPYITLDRAGGAPTHAMEGPATTQQAVVHVACYGDTKAQADAVAGVVQAALDGYYGVVTAGSETLNLLEVALTKDEGGVSDQNAASDGLAMVVIQTYRVWSR